MEIIKTSITNDDCLKERVEIANHDLYAYPERRYRYNVNINNLTKEFYIMNGKYVTGIFDNINFTSSTFFDCTEFKNVIFKNCYFDKIEIRWCKFINCQFINCSGEINYIRASTFKKDCVFKGTNIKIYLIDQYMYFNSKRYNGYYNTLLVLQ